MGGGAGSDKLANRPAMAVWRKNARLALLLALGANDQSAVNFVVRQVKIDLKVSEGLVSDARGSASGLARLAVGQPATLLLDRSKRRQFIASGVALWSMVTVPSDLSDGFLPIRAVGGL